MLTSEGHLQSVVRKYIEKIVFFFFKFCIDSSVLQFCKIHLALSNHLYIYMRKDSGPGSSVVIATDYGLDGPGIKSRWGQDFSPRPDRPWGPPSLLYNGYRVFPGGKVRPGRAAGHSPSSSAAVMEE